MEDITTNKQNPCVTGVPEVYERIRKSVEATIKKSPLTKTIFDIAFSVQSKLFAIGGAVLLSGVSALTYSHITDISYLLRLNKCIDYCKTYFRSGSV